MYEMVLVVSLFAAFLGLSAYRTAPLLAIFPSLFLSASLFQKSDHASLHPFDRHSIPSKKMNISEILPSENLLASFKKLETEDFVKLREVCKLWWRLLDENKVFWRILKVQGKRWKEMQSIVDQFDEKSGSTLEEISFAVKGVSPQAFYQLSESIPNSSQVLRIFTWNQHIFLSRDSKLPKVSQIHCFQSFPTCSTSELRFLSLRFNF